MPGNGVGDRVHNFFAQENLSQGLRSQDGNWPVNDNLGWVGNQKQFGASDSSSRNYNPQQSETERGHGGQRVPDPHIFNIAQTTARPEFSRSLSQSHHEQPNSNGYMYGRQNFQTRPDEANFLGVDTEYGRNNNVNQRGFPFYESQQEAVADQTPKNPIRPESSEAHGSFDLFGGQHQQMNSQYPGLMQPLQQQSGFGEIQQLQQQLMLRKMQELQRQELQRQEFQRQEVIRQQNSLNQPSSFVRQASGSHSHGLVNGTPTSDSSAYGWAEPAPSNTNWLHRASPAMHSEQGQPQRSMGFAQQQVEPSLYGVPISGSRGPLNQYPHNNALPGTMYAAIPEQHMVPSKGLFGNSLGQGSNSGGIKTDHIQQLNTPQNPSAQESPQEMLQDKSETDAAASLDPDEAKILFGSDDNIWEAFGSSKNMGGGVSSLLDDNEFASGLPSMQSGSWSALMQSAVAETTSSGGGVGAQEEWPDLNFQNPELPADKQASTYEDTGKQHTALGTINVPNMNDKNMGFQHHARNNPYEHSERPNVNDSKQMNQHSSGGSNWLKRGALQNADVKERRLYDNSLPVQRTSLQQQGTTQPNNKQSHWIANESFPPSANAGFNINENANSLQQPQSNDWKRVAMGNYAAAIPNISNSQGGGNQANHLSSNNSHLNHWKHVDSSVKSKGSENSEKSQRRLNNKGPQVSESSFNSSDKEDLKMHEMESSSRRENSNDSYRSSSSHLPNTKFQADAGDSRSLPGTKQSLSNQVGRKTSGQPKFQFHPMGNLDEDVGIPYGPRQGTNTTAISLQHSRGLGGQNQGNFGLTKTSGQGFVSELEGVPKDDMRFKGMIPGHVPNIFAPHDRSVGSSTSDKASQPSQNMLELLHKVDQSRDRGITRHLSSVEQNLSSEMPEPENSDGSFGGHQRSQSSNSQGIGLQLGPPSQRLSMSMQAVKPNSLIHTQASANARGKGHAESSLFPPTHETSHGELKNDRINISGQSESQMAGHKTLTSFPAALGTDFSNSRNQLQNHPTSGNESFNGHTPQIRQADETHGRSLSSGLYDNATSSEKSLASQSRANSGMSQQGAFPKMLPNSWSNHPSQQLFSAAQARKGQLNPSPSHQLNIVESTSLVQPKLEEQAAEKRGNSLSKYSAAHGITSVGEQSTEKVDQGQMMNGPAAGKNSINTPFSDTSSLNPTASQRDIEAFGRSLKPNNFHQSYSLLNQMKAIQNTDNDPENRVLKRLKDSDNFSSAQQVTAPPRDSEMPRFAGQTDNIEGNVASVPGNRPLKDGPAADQNGSQNGIPSSITTSGKTEHSNISPQMAPSWFDQYGTFKGGQIISQRTDAVRTVEPPFRIEKVSSSLEIHDSKETASGAPSASQGGVVLKTPVPSSVTVEQFSPSPLHANITVQNLVTARSKKRKFSTNEFHSWLKEVSGSVKNLHGICTASMGWCEATNRLMEKVEDDGELIEDVPRPKRRIILSTQLMQQLLPPPPARILSTDATSNYETVAFYASRLALGDACNLVSISGSSNLLLSDKSKESERMDDHRLSEVVEECLSKANRLENDFSRLDKRASILDLRVECQDLEKFSIINRFAKFHGRGQPEGGEASSSDIATTNTPKPSPQRYVIAVALPKNLPERVQCLSL